MEYTSMELIPAKLSKPTSKCGHDLGLAPTQDGAKPDPLAVLWSPELFCYSWLVFAVLFPTVASVSQENSFSFI
jgi:hypothetical protein